jgi:hypothetical protein
MDESEHEMSQWCWCSPKLENHGSLMVFIHHDVSPEVLASRKLAGGPDFESAGDAAEWRHLIP